MVRPVPLLLLFLLVGCAGPPADAYLGGGHAGAGVGIGRNASGESCTLQRAGIAADVFCGTWDQPSGHVSSEPDAPLDQVATASPWRSAMDARFDCASPTPSTILGTTPALVMSCTRKVGGWPQAALLARLDGRVYMADGILPAVPVLERAIAVLSGRATAAAAPDLPPGRADSLLAARLAAQSFSAGDIGQFQQLMTAGTRANLAENFPAAERAFRAAYALQRKALGADDPNTAVPLALIALQMSDEGRTAEATATFAQAARLAPGSADPTTLPRLHHYQALNALNAQKPAEALPLLQQAEAEYAASLPPDLLAEGPARTRGPAVASRRAGGATTGFDAGLLLEPGQQAALAGVVETRRYQAIALRELGRQAEAAARIRAATALARARGLSQPDLTARLSRTRSLVDDAAEQGSGDSLMRRAAIDFSSAQPGTRPVAETLLLQAAQAARGGGTDGALPLCRRAVVLLKEIKAATAAAVMAPCLSTFAAEAEGRPADRQALLAEMFEASQLVQGSITARQIALASARLSDSARNPRVGEAIRRQQDAGLAVADLQAQADAAAASAGTDRARPAPPDLGKRLAEARAALADADAALQQASPNYGQLVQQVAGAADVLHALAPGEAFVSLAFQPTSGWVFALRDGLITVRPTPVGSAAIAALVGRVRASVELKPDGTPPPFDLDAARSLFADTLEPVLPVLQGARALTVVPTGSLLSLPFETMLTGPASADNLAAAPWLMQRFPITHVPAPANFVSLRRVAAASAASQPWYGFGDFRPVTLQQAVRTFPADTCRNSARLFAGLPPLPFALKELTAARLLMGAPASDQLLGPAFNTPRVLGTDLRPFRVLHFATHALLPTDLSCQTEPAIVTSDVPGAPNANAALLTASDVTGMQLDADVVILSACNSGGPDGATSGESLSGLARAFFYAGARALMVTHWSVNDQATALLVAGTLQRLRAGSPQGLAGAFQGAQQSILAEAGRSLPAAIAHPFYWAPFALVGEGRGRTMSAEAAAAAARPGRLAGL